MVNNVHFISPYRTDKNIGRAINDAVAALNAADSDWIVHTDHDVLWLLPDSKKQVIEILSDTSYDLLTCRTNRLGLPYLVCQAGLGSDIIKHMDLAGHLQRMYGLETAPITRGPLAAFMLCFRKNLWLKMGGFTENSVKFDSIFTVGAMRKGFTAGVMRGVYVFHLYRMGGDVNNFDHLLNTE